MVILVVPYMLGYALNAARPMWGRFGITLGSVIAWFLTHPYMLGYALNAYNAYTCSLQGLCPTLRLPESEEVALHPGCLHANVISAQIRGLQHALPAPVGIEGCKFDAPRLEHCRLQHHLIV